MPEAQRHKPLPSHVPVLIVGGGPVGLMASLLLGRFGVPNLLVEKHRATSLFPKATRLNTRTMEMLRVLGIEAEVRSHEQQVGNIPLMLGGESLRGPVRFRVDGDPREEMYRYSPTTWAYIPQDQLEPILRAHAERQDASDIRFGVEVTGVDQDAEGVTVSLRERPSGEHCSIRAAYLIAADGAHSFARTVLGIGMSGDDRQSRELNILFRADLESVRGSNRSLLFQVRNEAVQGMIVMAGDGRWALHCPAFEGVTPERCADLVRGIAGVPDLAVEVLAINHWERAAVVAHRFRVGRVFLAGDAAHRLTPAGALGLNTGVQDAHNLAWKLSGVLAGWAGDGLLDSYETERRPVALRNVDLSRRFWERGRVGAATGYWLGFSYEHGALVPDGTALPVVQDPVCEYVPAARPGSRAPHFWLSSEPGVSILDHFDRELVLITDRRDVGWWTAAARIRAAGVPIQSVDPRAAEWATLYGVEPGGAVLVRPDGHVAWRARRAIAGGAVDRELRSVVDRILCRQRIDMGGVVMKSDGRMLRLTVDGAEIEYMERGSGEPLLLVHAGVFSDWFAPLSANKTLDGYRVIRVRRAGYGARLPDRHLTINDHARHCAALIAHLGLDSVHYVGHSSSCLIGLQLALDHPALVRSLTLLEPAPGGSLRVPAAMAFFQRVVGPAIEAAASGDVQRAFDLFMTGVGGSDYGTILEQRLGSVGYRQAIRESAFFFANECRAISEWSFGPAEAGRIDQPTLVAEGGESHRFAPMREIVERLTGLLPGAETARIEGVNHMMPLQDPDAVGRIIEGHVRRHPILPHRAYPPQARNDRREVEQAVHQG